MKTYGITWYYNIRIKIKKLEILPAQIDRIKESTL